MISTGFCQTFFEYINSIDYITKFRITKRCDPSENSHGEAGAFWAFEGSVV